MRILVLSLAIILFLLPAISAECNENWICSDWGKCINEMTERSCADVSGCNTIADKPNEISNCNEIWPYCYDKIINQDETDIDCGGSICNKCSPGKSCLINNDCLEGLCINRMCSLGAEIPAPSQSPAVPVWIIVSSLLIIALIIVAIKKLKRGKIIILSAKEKDKKEEKIEKKDLLNKIPSNNQSSSVKSWMLNNIKEAYEDD